MPTYVEEAAARLVAAETVSHQSDLPAAEYLADELTRAGFAVALQQADRDGVAKANVVARCGPPEPGGLILSGHIDVVPFADQPGWSRDPLKLGAAGGRLYGRGTSDMKGFLAQCLDAARRLDADTLRRPVVMLFTCDEEVGCLGAARLAEALPELLAETPQPRLAWIGEPTSYRVFHTHKGIVEFDVEVRGRGGHSGVPDAGVNAISVAARAIAEIGSVQAEYRGRGQASGAELFPEAPYTPFNLGTIVGGTAANMIAEACRFRVSYRPLPGEDALAPYRAVEARLEALEARDHSGSELAASISLEAPLVVPAMCATRGSNLEAALFAEFDQCESAGAPFCTDGGQFAAAGIESLICGPGDLDQAHQPDESVSREALARGPDAILRVVAQLCTAT